MPIYLSLLRGINVGGNKSIKMADLQRLYESLGFTGAQTLLQSGNVVFQTGQTDAAHIVRQLEARIEQTFGFPSSVILRTRDQWQTIIERLPFSAAQMAEPGKILVMCLRDEPTAAAFAELQAAYSGPEVLHLSGAELYIYYAEGMGRSKLTHVLLEKKLKTIGTGRNWNTVQKLLALAETMGAA